MVLQDSARSEGEAQRLADSGSRKLSLAAVLVAAALLLGLACGGSDFEKSIGISDQGELDLLLGSGFGDIVNRRGDVASIYSVGTGDYARGPARAGAALYRSTGARQRVMLPAGMAVNTWGAVGNEILMLTHPCSDPDNSEGDCKEEDRSPIGALLIDEEGETMEIALPPKANQVGRFLANTGEVAILQGADGLVSYDLASDTWSTIDGQGHRNSTTSFACPNLGLALTRNFAVEESGLATSDASAVVLKSVAVDGERIAGDVPMLRERDADPVACVDDGIVFQTKNGFETVSGAGKVTRSVPYPPEAEEGPGATCRPLAGPVSAVNCTTFGAEGTSDGTLVIDVGLQSQQAIPTPSLNGGSTPHALVPTGEDADKLNLMLNDGEAVAVSR